LEPKTKNLVTASVGRVSQFYDTRPIQFSQSNLQKGPVLPQKKFLKFYAGQGYQHFFLKFLISSHNAGFQKFENSKLSFVGSHKLGIILYFYFKN